MPFRPNRRHVLAATLGLPLAACVAGRTPIGRRNLRVATFNIWHDKGDWPARRKLIGAALHQADADIIGLQEVLEDSAKGLPNQAETLARDMGGYEVRFVSRDPEGAPRRYGNAILTRLPIVAQASKNLEPLNDYRTALRVRIKAGGQPVDVVVTHLAWQADAGAVRAQQVADLMSWLPGDAMPLIVMGDFNAPLTDAGLAMLAPPRFRSALPQGAFATTLNPARGHDERVIDHIFVERDRFVITDARLIGHIAVHGEYASDHFGVATTLQLR